MNGTITLILGGARSGKSTYAERLAGEYAQVTYLATAQAFDDEMRARIAKHRADRPDNWTTIECPHDVAAAIRASEPDCYLLDCLTLYVSNLLLAHEDDAEAVVPRAIDELLAAHRKTSAALILVSNEVGLGLVPDNPLGRRYRDLLGRANQQVAAAADTVLFLVAGLPMTMKSPVTSVP